MKRSDRSRQFLINEISVRPVVVDVDGYVGKKQAVV
jgi:hypothetical protein